MVNLGLLNISESDFIFTPVEVVAKEILRELLVMQNTNPSALNPTNYLNRYKNLELCGYHLFNFSSGLSILWIISANQCH